LSEGTTVALSAIFGVFVVLVVCGGLVGCPIYNVWSAKMDGEAALARANQSKQIIVTEANAQAAAEIARAGGTATANKLIGDSLKDNETYLKWLWLNKLDTAGSKTVIYVPTDGMVPQLETGRAVHGP
jgi:regulator of protease activity HflC (stomatin/prohibitin superfamily)